MQRMVVEAVIEIALGGQRPSTSPDLGRIVKAVETGAHNRSSSTFELGGQLIGERRLARGRRPVDTDPSRMRELDPLDPIDKRFDQLSA